MSLGCSYRRRIAAALVCLPVASRRASPVLVCARSMVCGQAEPFGRRPGARLAPPHFAATAAAVGAAATAALLAGSSAVGCAGGTRRVELGKVADFEEGTMREVELPGKGDKKVQVLVHRHGGVFYATSPACSHYGAPLKKGVSAAGGQGGQPTVTCPLHDASFDLATGRVVRGPSIDGIAVYKTSISKDTLYADIPTNLFSGSAHERVMMEMAKRTSKDSRVFVLLGGGAASLGAAETLRQQGFTGRIVLITQEPHLPYDRVKLSKSLDVTAESLQLRPADFFKKYDIEVIREATVTKLDANAGEVQFSTGSKTDTLKYDSVLVATGGSPRKLSCPGSDLRGIFTLRTPEDVANIKKLVKKGQKIVVVGGSFIGMEMASTLHGHGCHVAIVAMETFPFERVLGKKVGAAFARVLQKERVEWYGTAAVRLFREDAGAVNGVELEDGEVLPADAVIVGAGVLPNTGFVDGVALDKSGGITVTPLLNVKAVPNVFAAGDVCSWPSPLTGAPTRIEHWDVAMEQGRVAAQNMLGASVPFITVPFFWSSLFGKNLRYVGYPPKNTDSIVIEGDVGGMSFITYYTENDDVRAVATVNQDPVAVVCAELMRRDRMPKSSELTVGAVNAEGLSARLRSLSMATK